ncbi:MAG TPA: LysM peptidoglycan-binding domain-containing protein [Anaerolineae bacterium]|nr:LysM peptidoglycan-binding domain-containing protein [Anaerolineae bacterium]
MEGNVAELERRYQSLRQSYDAGMVDEETFVAEADKLQFQDDWGRYWMIGAQSGEWHYYDGQAWHQANPREADKLPFMDSEGRYWQKGVKSGDWYYYDSGRGEWVKPNDTRPMAPQSPTGPAPAAAPQNSFAASAPPYADAPMGMGQDTQLYQDDEGRYWAIGAKSNKWYFYDEAGWHPAEEFQTRTGGQYGQPQFGGFGQPVGPYPPAQHSYAPQQSYAPQPFYPQPHFSQPDPYAALPGAGLPPGAGPQQWPGQSEDMPVKGPLIAKSDEPQIELPKKSKAETETVVAEFFDDEPEVEVVDVEVITVFEPEPDPQPQTVAPEPQPEPQPEPRPKADVVSTRHEPEEREVVPRRSDEIVPKRTRPVSIDTSSYTGVSTTESVPRRKMTKPMEPQRRKPDSGPISPRQREKAPTVAMPSASSPTPSPVVTAKAEPTPAERRRARDNTVPIDTATPAIQKTGPLPTSPRHRQDTQPLPKIETPPAPVVKSTADPAAPTGPATPAAKAEITPAERRRARENTAPIEPAIKSAPAALAAPAAVPAKETTSDGGEATEGYTLGDILRSFPSTLWAGVTGVAILLITAVIIIAIAVGYGGEEAAGTLAEATPTLGVAIALDTTPTPGPTAESSSPVDTPTPATFAPYVNGDLGIRLEYPDTWADRDNDNQVIFSPSSQGLDFEAPKDISMRIGRETGDEVSVSSLQEEVLSAFPGEAEVINDGTISIASQTWTMSQIRFSSEDLNGEGIATLAVTERDEAGYFLIAAAPAGEWNAVQPVFQEMINSFEFVSEDQLAQAQPSPTSRATATTTADDEEEADEATPAAEPVSKATAKPTSTPTRRPTATPTPTPEVAATPLVYVVQAGDQLLSIASRFGVDVDLLAEENGIGDPTSLQIGQELTIPYTAEELATYNESNGVVIPEVDEADSTAEAEDEAEEPTAEADTPATEADEAAQAEPTPTRAAPASAPNGPSDSSEAAPVSGRIVYPAFNPNIQSYDVWLADLATGEQTPIVGNASQPNFNQDGSLLAYRSWDLGTRGIFFRDFVGGRSGRVTNFVEDGLPAWSPDGSSFVFSSRKEGDRVPRIYLGDQTGEDNISLNFQGEYPDVFPDGRVISRGCTPAGDCGVFIIGPRGGVDRKVSQETADTAPAVSPDGSKIAFMSSSRGSRNWEIWLMDANGENATRLTDNNNNDGLPSWSPDGKSIAYVSDAGGSWAVWVMNADGSNQRKLFDMKGSPDGKVLRDEANSKGWLEERISWAP